jgi:hypothetical protein
VSGAFFYMVVSGIALALIVSSDGGLEFGEFINNYFPCQQDPLNSFPCYGVYDGLLFLLLLIIFVSSIILTVVRGILLYRAED